MDFGGKLCDKWKTQAGREKFIAPERRAGGKFIAGGRASGFEAAPGPPAAPHRLDSSDER